jgi:peptidoglycan hydrolase-like protein with peptidoglycan-binding domain
MTSTTVKVPTFPLPRGWYFGWRFAPRQSVSGFYGNRGHLMVWQERMAERGWPIEPDGYFGDKTANVASAFQMEKGLRVTGRIDKDTWYAAWTAPIT